ncbi:MAG: hypothetical protein P4L85_22325 [Paludisphaera borealis]|uniref:hypothetical protein n=1 Tax=Paludisphaera borealis TaxID=1387353 RepID=UPI00283C491E|nr:hypothetical protein [Paludisphaera borealis]MDR3622103.1 hypothetical protein [Paludisphaera borealis]
MKHQYSIPLAAALLSCVAVFGQSARGADDVRDLFTDTWTAVDGLGRRLPDAAEVGPPRPNKTVAMFYFLWLGRSGELGPFDITKILAQDPTAMTNPNSPLWGPIHYPHHWGESIFGYYQNDDDGVLRKHAQMLADAGVDAVVFDVTNQVTYPQSWKALGRVFDEARRNGERVPKIAFLCPFWDPKKVVRELWEQLYKPGLYPELWFQWEGKPVILADPALLTNDVIEQTRRTTPLALEAGRTLGQTFAVDHPFDAVSIATPTWETKDSGATLTLYRKDAQGERLAGRAFEHAEDNAWLTLALDKPAPAGTYTLEMSDPHGRIGWWKSERESLPTGEAQVDRSTVAGDFTLRVQRHDETMAKILRTFTFRKPQPDYFQGPSGPRQWSWLEVHPQHAFYAEPGVPEQVSVGVGQNAVDGKLGVLSNPRSHGRSFENGREPGPEGRNDAGKNFNEQWRRALAIDPALVFVTGWNEWIAGRFDAKFPLAGSGPVTFCDQFNQEFSRDIEPMKGGHGDAYYYQLVANVRRYKGARPVPVVQSAPIQIDGRFDDWKPVAPEFRDTIGDPVQRDFAGWGTTLHYTNTTGRNDIVAAKASLDAERVSFQVQTRADLKTSPDGTGLLLFLDVDGDPKTGWLGYDFVVGRKPANAGRAVLERNVRGAYEWGSPVEVAAATVGNRRELAIPLSALGMKTAPRSLDFKWADGIAQTGDWSDFTLNGDVAPNDRFNYRAVFDPASH